MQNNEVKRFSGRFLFNGYGGESGGAWRTLIKEREGREKVTRKSKKFVEKKGLGKEKAVETTNQKNGD